MDDAIANIEYTAARKTVWTMVTLKMIFADNPNMLHMIWISRCILIKKRRRYMVQKTSSHYGLISIFVCVTPYGISRYDWPCHNGIALQYLTHWGRRYIDMDFREWNCMNLDSNFIEVHFLGVQLIILQDYHLNRLWLFYWRIYVSPGFNECLLLLNFPLWHKKSHLNIFRDSFSNTNVFLLLILTVQICVFDRYNK